MTVGVISYSFAGIYFYRDGFVPAPNVPFFRPLFFYKAVPQQYTSRPDILRHHEGNQLIHAAGLQQMAFQQGNNMHGNAVMPVFLSDAIANGRLGQTLLYIKDFRKANQLFRIILKIDSCDKLFLFSKSHTERLRIAASKFPRLFL